MRVEYRTNEIIIGDHSFKQFISKGKIEKRIRELAFEINNDYHRKELVFLITLKGAIFFAVDLLKKVKVPVCIETIIAKSYGNNLESAGKVNFFINSELLRNKDVLIVEDIVDTGLTISTIIEEVKKFEPKSIEVATFLIKPENLKFDIKIKYFGFKIPKDFVIGYGLDYAEFGRNLTTLYILERTS